jgi:hypothetical protein
MSLYVVEEPRIDELWPLLAPFLEPSLDVGNEVYIDNLYEEVKRRQGLLWVGYSEELGIYGAAITEIIQYPRKKVFLIKYLGAKTGAMKPILDVAMSVFRRFATELECDVVQLYGRKGWVNVLRPYGYTPVKYVCELDLKG